jgi:uncharacterized Zn finger protein (UPF0148 family)
MDGKKTGFIGTVCKIPGCFNKVWPNKTIGFCSNHYSKYRNGLIDTNGDVLIRKKTCESCGVVFELMNKQNNIRFCPLCREGERKKVQIENYLGEYRREQKKERTPIIYEKERIVVQHRDKDAILVRKREMIDFRQSGMTLAEIGERMNISRQRVQQILNT